MSVPNKIPNGLLLSIATDHGGALQELGVRIGRIYTDYGLPIDMSLDRLSFSTNQKIAILHGAFGWLVQHKRNSGATDKAIDRQRRSNRESMRRFIKTGETGVY